MRRFEHFVSGPAVKLIFSALPVVLLAAALLEGLDGSASAAALFFAGLSSGLAVMAWSAAPSRPKARARDFGGESSTARELDRLTNAGWRPVHDRALDRCDVDHIQIGPGGVFVIDSKIWNGKIAVSERGVTQDGKLRGSIARGAKAAALQIRQRVAADGSGAGPVTPVVVFWGDFPQGMVEQDKVTYLAGDKLVEWLRSRPASLNGAQIDQIASIVATMRPGVELSLAS